MNKVNQLTREKIEKLQDDYGECKITTKQFTEELTKLGFNTPEEVEDLMQIAEDARYEHKINQMKNKEKYIVKDDQGNEIDARETILPIEKE